MTRQRLYLFTRQPRIILRVCLFILLGGILTAWILGKWIPPRDDLWEVIREYRDLPEAPEIPKHFKDVSPELLQAFLPRLRTEAALETWLDKLRRKLPTWTSEDALKNFPPKFLPMRHGIWEMLAENAPMELATAALAAAELPEDRVSLYRSFIGSIWTLGSQRVSAQEMLEEIAAKQPTVPRASELLGCMWEQMANSEKALNFYVREGALPDASPARQKALQLCVASRQANKLRELLQLPPYAETLATMDIHERTSATILVGNYAELLRLHLQSMLQYATDNPPETLLTLLCGVIWFFMLHQLGGISVRRSWRGLLGLGLGCLSPSITLLIISLTRHSGGLEQNGEFGNDLLFYVAGVGLREEVSKLLLFAPMLWFLRGKSEAEILVVAGCVGLGFAIEENIGYFKAMGLERTPLGRVVSANFLHVAMTSLAGLALARWVRFPKSCWETGLATILTMIVIHGFYDFAIDDPVPHPAYSLNQFPMIILLGLAHYFLSHLKHVRDARGNVIAPLFAFLTGLSVLCALTLIGATMNSGFRMAIEGMAEGGLGAVFLIIMFSYHLHRE